MIRFSDIKIDLQSVHKLSVADDLKEAYLGIILVVLKKVFVGSLISHVL